MATSISYDSVGGPVGASAVSISWSHTISSGSDRVLVVLVQQVAGDITTATFNGVAMTRAYNQGGNPQFCIFYMVAPPVGTYTVLVNSNNAGLMTGASTSYFGVFQGNSAYGPFNSFGNGLVTTGQNMPTTTTQDKCWLIGQGVTYSNAVAHSAGVGTTVRASTSGTRCSIFDSNSAISPAGSGNLNETWAAGGQLTYMITSIIPSAGSRYWVGGTGSWDASSTTHWSLTSGGVSGASTPTSSDDVFFDASSGGGTATITATSVCRSLTFTGYTGTLAGSSSLSIGGNEVYLGGNLTLGSGMTITYTGDINFVSKDNVNVLTSNSKTLLSNIIFNSTSGSWSLGDTMTASTLTLTNGNLAPGSSTLTLTGSGTVVSAATTATYTPGTSTIKLTNATSSSKTFSGAGLTYGNLWITGSGTGTYTIVGSNSFVDFKVDTPPHTINFTAGSTQYVQTFTVSGTAGNLMTLQSTTPGTTWYMRKMIPGTVSCDYLSLRDSHVS